MARILGIDYGLKRCGVAVTDPLQIAVHGIKTLPKSELLDFVQAYCQDNEVEKIVIGHPGLLDGGNSPVIQSIEDFRKKLEESVEPEIVFHDESFSSLRAKQVLLHSGIKKKKRQEKGLLDKVSAVLILQDYLGHI